MIGNVHFLFNRRTLQVFFVLEILSKGLFEDVLLLWGEFGWEDDAWVVDDGWGGWLYCRSTSSRRTSAFRLLVRP